MSIPFALKKADDIRKKLGSISVQKDGEDISTTVSIGIATYPIHGNCIEELINQADTALYMAKEKGRNQVIVASEFKPAQEN